MKTINRTHLHGLWIAILLIIAIMPRILYPSWTEFKADEARLIALAWDLADGHQFPLRGIDSSVGLPNFGASVWIYSLPLIIWNHIYAPTIFTGILNGVAVILCYWLVNKHWGWIAGVVASLLYAASPWAIFHSRKIWAQNLLLFFTMIWGISLYKAIVERKPRWFIASIGISFFAFQLHLSAISLVVATILIGFFYIRTIGWKSIVGGVLVAGFTFIPFLLYLSTHPEVLNSAENRQWELHQTLFPHLIRLLTGWQFHAIAGAEKYQTYLAQTTPPAIPQLIWGGLILLGLIPLLRGIQQKESRTKHLLLLIWCVVPVLTFVYFPSDIEIHYLLPVFPAWYIVAGIGVQKCPPYLQKGLVGIAFIGSILHLHNTAELITFVAHTPTPYGYGSLLGDHLTATELLHATNSEEYLIVGDGENQQTNEFVAIYDVLLREYPHRFVNGQYHAVFPTHKTAVLLKDRAIPTHSLYGDNLIPVPSQKGDFAMDVVVLPKDHPIPIMEIKTKPFANGVQLTGYNRLTEAGIWQVHWQPTGASSAEDYHIYNHLLNENGERFAQQDASIFSASQWNAGDWVISQFQFGEQSQTGYTMRMGMYTYPDLQTIPIQEPQMDAEWMGIIDVPVR